MRTIAKYCLLCMLSCFTLAASAKSSNLKALRHKLDSVAKAHHATIGISVLNFEDGDTLTINNGNHYVMQSTYKLPLAIYIMHMVDKGRLKLDQKVHVKKEDLRETWSPLRTKYPDGEIDLTIEELLNYTVGKSDNNTCDILFRMAGGTKPVNDYIHSLGFKEIAITATELEMTKGWGVQYTNWTQPSTYTQMLKDLYDDKLLSAESTNVLMHIMLTSENSPNRIMGQLPAGVPLAHKTGTSNTNEKGITAAVNDVGIITLPIGTHVAIAVFVGNSTEPVDKNEKTIAQISRIIYDFFNKR